MHVWLALTAVCVRRGARRTDEEQAAGDQGARRTDEEQAACDQVLSGSSEQSNQRPNKTTPSQTHPSTSS